MSRYVVILTDDEQGYADIVSLGSFATRDAAETFAAKASIILRRAEENSDGDLGHGQLDAAVLMIQPARLRDVREWVADQ